MAGVDDVDIDMVRQKVTVTGWVDQKKVLKAVRKTGRTAVLWPYQYNVEYPPHGYTNSQYYNQYHPGHAEHHVTYGAHPYEYASTSSYNYRKHGYGDSYVHGYYQRPLHSSTVDEKARALFSDDNPNACSIM